MTELEALMEPNGENPNIVANGASSPEERTFLVDLTMEDTSDEAGDDETSENGSIASTRSSNEDDQDCDPEEWDARYTTGDADFREEDDELEKCWDPELSDEEEELVEDIVDEIGTPTINGLTFLRIVSEISQEINGDMSWDIDAIHALQEAAEDWLGIVLANALDIAVHAGRDFIEPGDVKLVPHLRSFDRYSAVASAICGLPAKVSKEKSEGVQLAATDSSDRVGRVATAKAN